MRKVSQSQQGCLGVSIQNNEEVNDKSLTKKQLIEQALENEVTLLPCPFCGGKAYFRETENDIGGKIWYIECTGCDLTVKNDYLPKALVRKWNTRKPIQNIVKKLAKVFPVNPYPNEFTNGRDLGIKKAIEIVENELN